MLYVSCAFSFCAYSTFPRACASCRCTRCLAVGCCYFRLCPCSYAHDPPFRRSWYGGSSTTFSYHQATDCELMLKSTPEPWCSLPQYQDYSIAPGAVVGLPLGNKRRTKKVTIEAFFAGDKGLLRWSDDVMRHLCFHVLCPQFRLQNYEYILKYQNILRNISIYLQEIPQKFIV